MMMIALIPFDSSLVLLIEHVCISNSWKFKFEFSGFGRNRTNDLGINSASLWPNNHACTWDTFSRSPSLRHGVAWLWAHCTRWHCLEAGHHVQILSSSASAPGLCWQAKKSPHVTSCLQGQLHSNMWKQDGCNWIAGYVEATRRWLWLVCQYAWHYIMEHAMPPRGIMQ